MTTINIYRLLQILVYIKKSYKYIIWRRIKDKTSNKYNFWSSTITFKLNINNGRKYYIGKKHSINCDNVNNNYNNYFNKNIDSNKTENNFKCYMIFSFIINKDIIYILE